MAIQAGQSAIAADFIDQAEKNATPANDEGRVPKLEADGKLAGFFTKNGQVLNAGETINGGTLPVPVYQNKTDNEVYACDANDTNRLKFIGFATSNGTDGNATTIQFSGVVGGFSGLAEGEKYYVQDTVGTIGTAPGTYEVLVGIAISTTELVIIKGKQRASGTTSFAASGTTVITCGFRPSVVRIVASAANSASGANFSISWGAWTVQGGNDCAYIGSDNSANCLAGTSPNVWYVRAQGSGAHHQGQITSVTDTGFTLSNTEDTDGRTVNIMWEAEGEL